jgi:glutamate racemase
MKIGVFDSGIGGQAVAEELRRLVPDATVISINDSKNVPYGGRPRAEIIKLTMSAIEPLIQAECDAIVIACNTATTNVIQLLRHDHPSQKFIGLEPMVKPAAQLTRSNVIAVLATPATLASPRYQQLKDEWAQGIQVLEPDCSDWARLIETDQKQQIPLRETIEQLLTAGVDSIVLGCTHYHWLKSDIEAIVGPDITVFEPSNAIKNRLFEIIS